jgi:hypothetical protein
MLFLLGFSGLVVGPWPFIVPRHITIWSDRPDQFGATDLLRDDYAIAVRAVDVERLLPKINCK